MSDRVNELLGRVSSELSALSEVVAELAKERQTTPSHYMGTKVSLSSRPPTAELPPPMPVQDTDHDLAPTPIEEANAALDEAATCLRLWESWSKRYATDFCGMTKKERNLLGRAVAEHGEQMVLEAIKGAGMSAWHRGQNQEKRPKLALADILHAGRVERLSLIYRNQETLPFEDTQLSRPPKTPAELLKEYLGK